MQRNFEHFVWVVLLLCSVCFISQSALNQLAKQHILLKEIIPLISEVLHLIKQPCRWGYYGCLFFHRLRVLVIFETKAQENEKNWYRRTEGLCVQISKLKPMTRNFTFRISLWCWHYLRVIITTCLTLRHTRNLVSWSLFDSSLPPLLLMALLSLLARTASICW